MFIDLVFFKLRYYVSNNRLFVYFLYISTGFIKRALANLEIAKYRYTYTGAVSFARNFSIKKRSRYVRPHPLEMCSDVMSRTPGTEKKQFIYRGTGTRTDSHYEWTSWSAAVKRPTSGPGSTIPAVEAVSIYLCPC